MYKRVKKDITGCTVPVSFDWPVTPLTINDKLLSKIIKRKLEQKGVGKLNKMLEKDSRIDEFNSGIMGLYDLRMNDEGYLTMLVSYNSDYEEDVEAVGKVIANWLGDINKWGYMDSVHKEELEGVLK